MRQKDENPLFRGTMRIVFYVHILILSSMSVYYARTEMGTLHFPLKSWCQK